MPHIDINLYPGRTTETKQEMARKIVDFCVKELGLKQESLSVSFSEYSADEFAAKVMQKVRPEDVCISSPYLK